MKNNSWLTQGYSPELAQQIRATRPGQAHFARTGPAGATCGGCAFLGYWKNHLSSNGELVKSTQVRGCEKFLQLTGRHGPVLPTDTPACRYFERRQDK